MSHVIAALIIFHLRPPTSALTLHPLQNLLGVTLEPLNTEDNGLRLSSYPWKNYCNAYQTTSILMYQNSSLKVQGGHQTGAKC